jgi:agmatine deiminase
LRAVPFWLTTTLSLLVCCTGCVERDNGVSLAEPGRDQPQIEPLGRTPRSLPHETFFTYIGGAARPMLPKWETQWERDLARTARAARPGGTPAAADVYSDYRYKNIKRFFVTKPPATAGIRTPAEYEPSQAYVLHWDSYSTKAWKDLFGGIVKGAWGVVPVLMVYRSASNRTYIEKELAALGYSAAELKDPKKIIWWEHKTNAIWARDFGPVSIVNTPTSGTPTLSFVDFRYYHARHLDDEIPSDLAKEWGINVFRPDLDMEGGNFQTTSDGLCSATKGTLYYNLQYTQSAVEDIFADYLGCKKSLFPATMTGGVIAHIDMFSKYGSDTTMIVGEYTTAQSADNKKILDANTALFAATKTPSGKTVTVTRIPMPDNTGGLWGKVWRTYTNSLSLSNGTDKVVLIPTYSKYATNEAAAIAAYAKAFPGWKLVKIDSEIIIPMQGAIHCITMQIPEGAHAKMEADPAPLCDAGEYICTPEVCGNIKSVGCCTPGGFLKYCDKGGKIRVKDCTSKPSCGWDSAKSLYNCGTGGSADPGGTNPLGCNVVTDAGVQDAGTPDQMVNTCGSVTVEGCCDGHTLWYCLKGKLKWESCWGTKNLDCGWDSKEDYYACGSDGKADPAGTYPMSCGVYFDAGPPNPEAGIPQPCGQVPFAGCCAGQKLKICQSNNLKEIDCGALGKKCGWGGQTYICGTTEASEPSGGQPRVCPGLDLGVDLATPDQAALPDTIDQHDGGNDAGLDGATEGGDDEGGCGCSTGAADGTGAPLALSLVLLLALRRRRRKDQ